MVFPVKLFRQPAKMPDTHQSNKQTWTNTIEMQSYTNNYYSLEKKCSINILDLIITFYTLIYTETNP